MFLPSYPPPTNSETSQAPRSSDSSRNSVYSKRVNCKRRKCATQDSRTYIKLHPFWLFVCKQVSHARRFFFFFVFYYYLTLRWPLHSVSVLAAGRVPGTGKKNLKNELEWRARINISPSAKLHVCIRYYYIFLNSSSGVHIFSFRCIIGNFLLYILLIIILVQYYSDNIVLAV